MTGGLLVALAAKYNEASPGLPVWERFRPHLAFNAGRLISYALLGGVVGALDSALTLTPAATSALNADSGHRDYSITSSERACRLAGISIPCALAALRLITNSNVVGCITGRSAGLAPLRMRPT